MPKSRLTLYSLLTLLAIGLAIGVYTFSTTAQQAIVEQVLPEPVAADKIPEAPEVAVPAARGGQVDSERFDIKPAQWTQRDVSILPEYQAQWDVRANKLTVGMPAGSAPSGDEAIFLSDRQASDQSLVAAQFFPQGNQVIGLVFGSSENGYYLFRVFADSSTLPHRRMLQRFDPKAGYTTIADDAKGAGYQYGQWQELRVERSGSKIICWFGSEKVFELEDNTLGAGMAGVYTLNTGDVYIDNFTVAQP
ncbi:MAG: hypothetical protein H0T53_09755 [Herpetosiphonaceae bacterium]|nr:hypothetical protein [Herpetosiphonaceae bacterium]